MFTTIKTNPDSTRPEEDAEKKAAPSTMSDVLTAPVPSNPQAARASDSYAAWRSKQAAARLEPYVPTSLDDIPLPPPDVVTTRDRHTIDLQIAKLTKAWKDSGRNVDEYLQHLGGAGCRGEQGCEVEVALKVSMHSCHCEEHGSWNGLFLSVF